MRTNNRFKTTIVTKNLSNYLLGADIIATPYEKVLSIIKQTKNFISTNFASQIKLIQNLEWCIEIISSHSLYSYELKEKEAINKMSQNNPELKQLVDFVSEYNEKVIEMNRKYNYILTDKLLEKSSTKLNKRKIERKKSFHEKNSHFSKLLDLDEGKQNLNFDFKSKNRNWAFNRRKTVRNSSLNFRKTNSTNFNKYMKIDNGNPFEDGAIKKKMSLKKGQKQITNNVNEEKKLNKTYMRSKTKNDDSIDKISSKLNKTNYLIEKTRRLTDLKKRLNKENQKFMVSFNQNYINKKTKNIFPSVQKISITINNDNHIGKEMGSYQNRKEPQKKFNSINAVNISLTNSIVCSNNNNNTIDNTENSKYKFSKFSLKSKSRKNIPHISDYSYIKFQNKLIHEGYDISKLITDKNFNIFELKDLIGYNNVLPMMGRTILENLGLLDEEILNKSKLDEFLVSVSKQYKEETLYHNSMHGSDVTQSVYIFFTHSNAEKLAKTNVLDLLSIIIAALGHDISHPGLTNTFHINDSTDMAITYNDISVLENFHASTLFRTLRKTENNIFDKLTSIDYKMIRKRMISEILATDMANHGKVLSLIKSKLILNENDEYKLNLLSGNEQTKIEEQQSLLDYMIHLADLAHNTKLFEISRKWVELLSEEFWRQGDMEKELNLPVSFLCDREDIDIPKSQKGFISGYIIPTYESLVKIFPTLRFTLENANNNLIEWQKLMNQGRKKGWTPEKDDTNNRKNPNEKLYKSIKNKKILMEDFSSLNKEKDKEKHKDKEKKDIKKNNEKKLLLKKYNKKNNFKFSRNLNKNIVNSIYKIRKNKKSIEINKDEDLNKTTNITKPQNNTTIHKTLNTSTIKKSILKIYKDKLNNTKKNKTIRFKTEENNEKK